MMLKAAELPAFQNRAFASPLFTLRVLIARDLLKLVKDKARLLGVVAQPLIFWLVIGSGFAPSVQLSSDGSALNYMDYFFPGIIAMVVLFSSIFSSITIIEDRNAGLLQAVLVGPAERYMLVLGKVLGSSLVSLLQVALLLLALPFTHVALVQIDWLWLLYFLAIGAFAFVSLGFFFAWLLDSSAGFHGVMSVLLIPMWIVSGALFPPKGFIMETLAAINPMGWLFNGLRSSLGMCGATVPRDALLLFLFATLCFSLSVWICYRRR
jgi:ABC-2 type transport system permease protein